MRTSAKELVRQGHFAKEAQAITNELNYDIAGIDINEDQLKQMLEKEKKIAKMSLIETTLERELKKDKAAINELKRKLGINEKSHKLRATKEIRQQLEDEYFAMREMTLAAFMPGKPLFEKIMTLSEIENRRKKTA